MEALENSVQVEYQIPNNLPNVEEKVRPAGKNTASLHNFLVYVFGHILATDHAS